LLHELNLAGIIGAQTFGRGRPLSYLKAVLDNEGIGATLSVMRRFAQTRRFPGYLTYDFNRIALRQSQGLIVHNEFMHKKLVERLDRWQMSRPIYRVPMGIPPAPLFSDDEARRARHDLCLDDGAFVVGSFGVVHESKGIEIALYVFKRLLQRLPNAVYLLVGKLESATLPQTIELMGLKEHVRLTGYVEIDNFYRYAAACDVGINLRIPQTGGTSASLLRLLSVGRPVIISNHAQFTETPDDICLKAGVGDDAEDSVLAHLLEVHAHPERARQIGERARRYIVERHSLEQAGQAWWDAIRDSVWASAKNLAKVSEPSQG
jgi:glycosyltransferase involved in cell wall biosynthesis